MRNLLFSISFIFVLLNFPSISNSQTNQIDNQTHLRISTIHQASGICGLFPPLFIPPVSTIIVPNLVALVGSAEGLREKSNYLAYGIVGVVTGPINTVANLGLLIVSTLTIRSCEADGIGLTVFNLSMIALGLTTSIVSGLKIRQVKKMRAPKPKEYSPFINWPSTKMKNRIYTIGTFK